LKKKFEEYGGTITSMQVQIDPKTKKPYGFICFATNKEADVAFKMLNDKYVFNNE
jgi:RNA recognition motif-containing protein